MKASKLFPSEFLRAVDVEDSPIKVRMRGVQMKDVGGDHKPVLYFQDIDTGLVLNKTNANTIAELHGDDIDGWGGKEIVLFATTTDMKGKNVPCIRVRGVRLPSSNKIESGLRQTIKEEMNDDVPF